MRLKCTLKKRILQIDSDLTDLKVADASIGPQKDFAA